MAGEEGRMRLLSRVIHSVPQTESAREAALAEEEVRRAGECVYKRMYARGQQYDDRNLLAARAAQCSTVADLPEHEKLLAYSTQIGECLDFLSDRLGEGFTIEADDESVGSVIEEIVKATEQIAAMNEEGDVEVVTDDLLWEAMAVGDVAAYVGWDPFEQRAHIEFWESEHVEFRMATTRVVEKVIRSEVVWREVPSPNGIPDWREVTERLTYEMAVNEMGVMECRVTTTWDGEEDPIVPPTWLGIGRIPWVPLRVDKRTLRTYRGEALVSTQVMMQADRYNANEQNSYLIARYNSHGNLVVIGDNAALQTVEDGRMHKDVADVLTFAGGTQAIALTLPTDPQMIEHQRSVLNEAMFGAFGLTPVNHETIQGLGGVSGYALEILNQKSDATFKRVARRWRSDLIGLLALCLDVTAWKRDAPIGLLDPETLEFTEVAEDDLMTMVVPEGRIPMQSWWTVDPNEMFPNRKIKIVMGTGYIVDDVMIREDVVSGVISRAEGLRKRGYDPKEITDIGDEIVAETKVLAEAQGAAMGQTTGESSPATKVKSGSTVGSA